MGCQQKGGTFAFRGIPPQVVPVDEVHYGAQQQSLLRSNDRSNRPVVV